MSRTRVFRVGAGVITAATAIVILHEATRAQSTTETLLACYVPSSGTVYRVQVAEAPNDCVDPAHVKFSWNAQGPAGPTGAQGPGGPTGATGAAGPAGANGVSGWERVSFAQTFNGSVDGGEWDTQVNCPTGKVVLGGGNALREVDLDFNSRGFAYVLFSEPHVNGTSWHVGGHFLTGSGGVTWTVTVFALCGKAS